MKMESKAWGCNTVAHSFLCMRVKGFFCAKEPKFDVIVS